METILKSDEDDFCDISSFKCHSLDPTNASPTKFMFEKTSSTSFVQICQRKSKPENSWKEHNILEAIFSLALDKVKLTTLLRSWRKNIS